MIRYPAVLTWTETSYRVSFPDFPDREVTGSTRAEVCAAAAQLLAFIVRSSRSDNKALPRPTAMSVLAHDIGSAPAEPYYVEIVTSAESVG